MSVPSKAGSAAAVALVLAALWPSAKLFSQTGHQKQRPTAVSAPASNVAALATARNLGKAYYEQGDYPAATREFHNLVASGRALAIDYFDLALSQMQSNKFDAALGSFATAKQMDPKLLSAEFGLGILYKREMRFPDAERALERVTQQDPLDPAAWFNLATVYAAQQKYEQAAQSYERVLKMGFEKGQNFYVVSLFHMFNTLVRLKRPAEAQKYLALHEQHRDKVPRISIEQVALESGKHGTILLPKLAAAAAPERNEPVRFDDVTRSSGLPEKLSAGTAGFFAGDYDGDGRTDLFVSGAQSHLYHQRSDGSFEDVTKQSGVEGSSRSAIFADYDNSGHTSLIVGGSGFLKIDRRGDTGFSDQTKQTGISIPQSETVLALVAFDADNDGLLDLLAGTSSGARLFRNNGDGTFSDITEAAGLAAEHAAVRQAAIADFNNDNFMDLVLVRDGQPPIFYLNQGGAKFTRQTPFGPGAATKAEVADFDHDGFFDVTVWTSEGPAVFINQGDATFGRLAVPRMPAAGTLVDADGDGYADLVAVGPDGRWQWLANRGGKFEERPIAIPAARNPADVSTVELGGGALELLVSASDGATRVFRRESPASHWIDVALRGQKSNLRGTGSTIEVKAGNYYQKLMATGDRVHVFTGDLAKLDVVRVTWPNGIVQNVVKPAANETLNVRESERVASSCPMVYGWDGAKWAYVTDVLGASPLGELAPDGSLLSPNTRELVRLPDWVKPRDGSYTFQFTDEMREVDYFDSAQLVAVDHLPGEQVYANEIYASSPTAPELYKIRERQPLASAIDSRGRDVRFILQGRDGRYLGDFRRLRIPGIAEMHSLTLDLGRSARADHVALWLTGWVFWTDSNGAQALRTQTTQMVGPYLQVRDRQGKWVTVIDDMGLPSGTDRSMRVDLSGKFLSGDRHVRIVTNLCVYWDEIFFTTHEQPITATAPADAATADLHYRGFATPVSNPLGIQPDRIEYTRLDTLAPWSPVPGLYTRYGDVRALVSSPDDRMVVMGPGDELTVSFPANALPRLPAGMRRQRFLLLDGWAKDNEPNTVTGNTSGPLPFRTMKTYPYPVADPGQPARRDYEEKYQTRPARALIPPLAPIARAANK